MQARLRAWNELCLRPTQTYSQDGSACADCKTTFLHIEKKNENALRVVCAQGHSFWFVRGAEPCARCECPWTDSSRAQKQLRKADEGATLTVVCLRGCVCTKSG
jgi:hypothetical protein